MRKLDYATVKELGPKVWEHNWFSVLCSSLFNPEMEGFFIKFDGDGRLVYSCLILNEQREEPLVYLKTDQVIVLVQERFPAIYNIWQASDYSPAFIRDIPGFPRLSQVDFVRNYLREEYCRMIEYRMMFHFRLSGGQDIHLRFDDDGMIRIAVMTHWGETWEIPREMILELLWKYYPENEDWKYLRKEWEKWNPERGFHLPDKMVRLYY